ncbi:hypothetical protein PG985_015008 [Apiospora marii]|uniref:Wax synthase domain-containing protein n=1 Tax=Apiospora marii TaxID=335849 RepID=A0ABR1RJE7_9PEZI
MIPLRESEGSILPHLLLLLVPITTLAGPRFPQRRSLAISAIIGLAIACHANQFTQSLGLANLLSLAWPHYLLCLANFVFASAEGPEGDLWRIDRPPREALSLPAFSLRKFIWAFVTLFNTRGIRWNYESARGEREGTARFVLLQLVDLVWMVLMADLVSQLGRHCFFIDPATNQVHTDTKRLSVRGHGALDSMLRVFVFGAGPYFFINIQYVLCSIPWVLMGWSQPQDWPPLFGHLSEATTVRKFWNRFWHHIIRNSLTSFSTAASRHLGLTKGSTLYSYSHLWIAFTISAVMHAGSMVILPSPVNISLAERTVGLVVFFLWQAFAISVEDFVQWAYGRITGGHSGGSWHPWFGYMWVVCSFWYSLPHAGGVFLRLRMGQDSPLPFSVFRPLAERLSLAMASA